MQQGPKSQRPWAIRHYVSGCGRIRHRKLLRYYVRTTITGTFANCATAALTAPRRMRANPLRP
jgi:hypothetical protein